ncbi:MAG: hypothetical protein LW875_12225 [Proteobacteria bacterium]|jgi:hypothetical protein|nr:hypothetical protein [Pseudomonadota bacterium]
MRSRIIFIVVVLLAGLLFLFHSSKDQSNLKSPQDNHLSEDRMTSPRQEVPEMKEITLSETSNTLLGQVPQAPAGEGVKVQFLDALAQFESSLKNRKPEEALKEIPKLVYTLQELRKRASRQGDADEIYMDLIQAVLTDFPQPDQFQKKSCPDYKLTILSQYDPQSGSRPTEPGVERAFQILEIICR